MAGLTTHILDTAHGRPAAGVRIRLFQLQADTRQLLTERTSNQDGRCDQPLLDANAIAVGQYELEFAIGDYFAGLGVTLPEPRFLDVVPIRFGIAQPTQHYHVPLLVSPFSFSTYRGS
ncbi:hydroxyisourate hydrolase [Ahniella affigens]|uniref:5-hydroxyisourate hydrolase n=1 Tax=Ahniella affigens TaxID=2021234 RepID=A0A2P1PUI8_9GAMM|nr:hydroxyisourate hydrolase [Ahniella affigens]AVP98509.1 hydroxyisourate hydrolase [Ahniella affigens]